MSMSYSGGISTITKEPRIDIRGIESLWSVYGTGLLSYIGEDSEAINSVC